MDKNPQETRIYKFLSRLVKMHSRDSRREFHLLLLAICLFLASLAAQFWSSNMSIMALILLIASGVFFGLFVWFYFYTRKPDLGDPQEKILAEILETQKKMLETLEKIDRKLDNRSD